MPLPPKNELEWWYQYYFATERGRAGYEKYTHDFAKLIWQIASPKWKFDNATFERTSASFDNPDHVNIVIHNYRWRLGLAEGRTEIRRSRKAACRISGHHRADDYRFKVTPTARRVRTPVRTLRNSPASIRTDLSGAALGIICRKKPARLCQSCGRCRPLLIGVSLGRPADIEKSLAAKLNEAHLAMAAEYIDRQFDAESTKLDVMRLDARRSIQKTIDSVTWGNSF